MKAIEVELFPKVNDRSTHSVQSLERLLKWTTTNTALQVKTSSYRQFLNENPNATPKEKSDKKLYYFPAITFSGTFSGTGTAKDIIKMSGLIVLDFDHIDNFKNVYEQLKNDNLTHLLFVSPSGDGLKLVVKHNLKDALKWQTLYYELEDSYLKRFELQTDKSGKDINRMCFLPYMDTLYQNDKSVTWEFKGDFENKKVRVYRVDEPSSELNEPSNLVKECLYIAQYLFENHINITDTYSDWISYGFSLCELGEEGRAIYHIISSVSLKYDEDTINKEYDYMMTNYDEDKSGIENYISNGKKAIADYCLYKKYGFLADKNNII